MFHHVYGQQIKGAVIGGLNATQVDGDEVFGYHKFGVNVGAAAIIPFSKKFSVGLENLFNQKGSYRKPIYEVGEDGSYKLKLNYVEVPVLIHYTDRQTMTFGTGLSWGRLVSVKEWEHGKRIETTTLRGGPYKRDDVNLLLDFRFSLYKNLKFNFRYAYSVNKIRTRIFLTGEVRNQYNNILTFRLIWIFNEDPIIKKKKNTE